MTGGSGVHLNHRYCVCLFDDYAHLDPFVETADRLLLKTIIPSRKAARRYIWET